MESGNNTYHKGQKYTKGEGQNIRRWRGRYTKVEGQKYEGGGADHLQNLIEHSTLQRRKPPKAFKAIKAFKIRVESLPFIAGFNPLRKGE